MEIWSTLGMLETFKPDSNEHIHSHAHNNNCIYSLKENYLFLFPSVALQCKFHSQETLMNDFMNTKHCHVRGKQIFIVLLSLLLLRWIPFRGLIHSIIVVKEGVFH